MATEQHAAVGAPPRVLVLDLVAVFRRDVHAARAEGGGDFGRPRFEGGAVRLVFDAAEHEVCQVAVFVREDVEEPRGGVDDFRRELDRGVVAIGCGRRCAGGNG